MFALVIVLNQTDYLEDILSKFVHLGVGATIIDSQGMAAAIVHGGIQSIPMFGSLKTMLSGSNPFNKTIFTVLKDEATMKTVKDTVMNTLKKVGPSTGFMFTLPVNDIVSLG